MLDALLDAQFLVSSLVIVTVIHVILGAVAYLIYVERKIASYTSDRVGPNRVGFDFNLPILAPLKGLIGLGQPLADGLKFMLKEDYAANRVDKIIFTIAPAAIIIPALIGFAIIPWGGSWNIPEFTIPVIDYLVEGTTVHIAGAPVNVGIIYVLAVTSLGIYGVVLGGWASNNKYSLLGSLRASAQMLSYEIPIGLSLLAVLLMTGSLLPQRIIGYQIEHEWLFLSQPVACIIFFIAILAESNRTPFDNAESENDLVGGYHTEYSSMRFALFFLAEYAHVITSSAMLVLLFFGGWDPLPGLIPMLDLPIVAEGWAGFGIVLLKCGIYAGKVATVVIFFMFLRWTLPRLRYDQVMQRAWQGVIPISLAHVVMTAVLIHVGVDRWGQGWGILNWLPMFAANALFVVVLLGLQPLLPRDNSNRKVRLAGSRFYPALGEDVVTAPSDPLAVEDRPIEGTQPVAG